MLHYGKASITILIVSKLLISFCVIVVLLSVVTAMFSDIPVKKKRRKLWWAAPLASSGQIWKERDRVVFEDAPFSHIRLKHSIISSLLYWAGIIPNVDISFVRTLPSLYMTDPRS